MMTYFKDKQVPNQADLMNLLRNKTALCDKAIENDPL
jgi:hypothetical protein